MDYRDYQEQQDAARRMALAEQHAREMEHAAPGDGEPCYFGPTLCPVCGTWQAFEETHNCLSEGDRVTCHATGRTITRAEIVARKVEA